MSEEIKDRSFTIRLNVAIGILVALGIAMASMAGYATYKYRTERKPADVYENLDATREELSAKINELSANVTELRVEVVELKQEVMELKSRE